MKIPVPVKGGNTPKLLTVPPFVVEGMDNNACMTLKFVDIPYSKLDTVLAVSGDIIVGYAKAMFFCYQDKELNEYKYNLFPLTVQMHGSPTLFDVHYYSFKLNKVLVLRGQHLMADEYFVNPLNPITILRAEMIEHEPH